eukprot:11170325-Lingulodinium_polyedra.AAC.1
MMANTVVDVDADYRRKKRRKGPALLPDSLVSFEEDYMFANIWLSERRRQLLLESTDPICVLADSDAEDAGGVAEHDVYEALVE